MSVVYRFDAFNTSDGVMAPTFDARLSTLLAYFFGRVGNFESIFGVGRIQPNLAFEFT
jgi:hypothetical protein